MIDKKTLNMLTKVIMSEEKNIKDFLINENNEFSKYMVEKTKAINATFSNVDEPLLMEFSGLKEICSTKSTKSKKYNSINNFLIIPTHRLRYDDGVMTHEIGLQLDVIYPTNLFTYKRMKVKLTNEMFKNGAWISPNILDYEYILKMPNKYQLLKRAIYLSTQILTEEDSKYFVPEVNKWMNIKKYYSYNSQQSHIALLSIIRNDEKYRISLFLYAIIKVLENNKLLQTKSSNQLSDGHIGWETDEKYLFEFSPIKNILVRWLQDQNSIPSFNLSSEFLNQLYEAEIIGANKEKGKPRYDKKLIFDDKTSTRVLEIDKKKFEYHKEMLKDIISTIDNKVKNNADS